MKKQEMITKKEVEHIAELAKLNLSEEEKVEFTHQLNDIISYMDKLNELDTTNVEPLTHPVPVVNVFREDERKESIDKQEALKNAPNKNDDFFIVPKVIN